MKKVIILPVFALLTTFIGAQTTFTKLTGTPLTTTVGDSRSVNIIDVNNDGKEDVFISNGLEGGQNNELYLNISNNAYQLVQNDPIVLDNSPSDGATFADADNDGDLDGYMVTWYNQPNFYYTNNGMGQFTHLPSAVTGNLGTFSETAAFADYDKDGLVDLYITNSGGDLKNLLYRNTGNHQYVKVTAAWLNEAKASRAAVWADYDNDGDQDLFVAHEGANTNSLFRNNGANGFAKLLTDPVGQESIGSITASWGDVNNDGFQDLFVGNTGFYIPKNNRLFLNNGNGGFVAAPAGPINSDGGCTFGSAFADYDNDGDLDLFVANGFCNGTIVNFLYKNDGLGVFERDLTALPSFITPCSFGTAWGDLNNDGFQDLVIATCKNQASSPQPPNLVFMNNTNTNHWLKIRLTGVTSNRSAIGAQIVVKAIINGQSVSQMREISGQTGYASQNSLIAHFGLGDADSIESVTIRWPLGIEQILGNIAIDQSIAVTEGQTPIREPNMKTLTLKIWPNPVVEILNWQVETLEPIDTVQFALIDSGGRTCYAMNVTRLESGTQTFSTSIKDLAKGVYSLRMTDGRQRETVVQVVVIE